MSPVKQKMQKNKVVVQIESQVQDYYLVRLVLVADGVAASTVSCGRTDDKSI